MFFAKIKPEIIKKKLNKKQTKNEDFLLKDKRMVRRVKTSGNEWYNDK